MSSGEYQEGPPPQERTCPHCGALIRSGNECWYCHASIAAGEPPQDRRDAWAVERKRVEHNDYIGAWVMVVVLTVLIGVGGVCAGGAPGLVMLLVPVPPVVVWLAVSRSRKWKEGERKDGSDTLFKMAAIGIIMVVGVASFIAFFAICASSYFPARGGHW